MSQLIFPKRGRPLRWRMMCRLRWPVLRPLKGRLFQALPICWCDRCSSLHLS